jgi:hypothetical protein
LADLVLSTDNGVRELLASDRVREKRGRTRVLYEKTGGQRYNVTGSNTNPTGGTINFGPSTIKYYYLVYSSSSYSNIVTAVISMSYTMKQLLRVFATWEYFVPRPHDLRNRLDHYKAKAAEIAGLTSVDEATVYELSPWTWLADWFVDIGGLLRYQRDVIDNQLVATACGYSTWEEYACQAHYSERIVNANAKNYAYPYYHFVEDRFTGVTASIQMRRHKRRGGNPYSIGPSWNFNPQQWGILGALGLSRGVDLPNKR